MMSSLLKPDGGSVVINSGNHRTSVGICPQNIVIWENLTCIEQLVFMGNMYNMTTSVSKSKALELLESLGLIDVKDRLAKNLSGGMQRRLNIALALIHSPEILFLDEPQAGLDPQSRVLVRDYIRSIKSQTTIVLTTHDMEEAEKLSDRICIIDNGKLLVTGNPPEIKKTSGYDDVVELDVEGDIANTFIPFIDPDLTLRMVITDSRVAFSVRDPISAASGILEVVKQRDLKVSNMRLRKTSLEDIFISLTGRKIRE